MPSIVTETSLADLPVRRGKVRDIYDLGDTLLLVSTDRISAFDWVLPTGIPDKGRVLTQLSRMWFDRLDVPHHFLSADLGTLPLPPGTDREALADRSMVVRKTRVVPIECVVRGYLSGSGWKEYQQSGRVCGVELPAGLRESDRLPEPIFTPATKADTGHDINISEEEAGNLVGRDLIARLKALTLAIYGRGAAHAESKGIIVADTKFEFGQFDGELILIDEVLTPDSSRFWPIDTYRPGRGQPSFDKQYVRDWLNESGWDHEPPAPPLPEDVAIKTGEKYAEAYTRITGRTIDDHRWTIGDSGYASSGQ